jgi:ribonuclease HI
LAEKCSNNQTEQLAIVKALTKLSSVHTIQASQRTTAIHTDSRITLQATANPRNHQSLVESNKPGNELADQLAKEAACDNSLQTAYHKYHKSSVTSDLRCLGIKRWQSECDSANTGALIKPFFTTIKDRLTK